MGGPLGRRVMGGISNFPRGGEYIYKGGEAIDLFFRACIEGRFLTKGVPAIGTAGDDGVLNWKEHFMVHHILIERTPETHRSSESQNKRKKFLPKRVLG